MSPPVPKHPDLCNALDAIEAALPGVFFVIDWREREAEVVDLGHRSDPHFYANVMMQRNKAKQFMVFVIRYELEPDGSGLPPEEWLEHPEVDLDGLVRVFERYKGGCPAKPVADGGA